MTESDKKVFGYYSKEVVSQFNPLSRKEFDFLRSEYGMVGPEERELCIRFQSPGYNIEIGLAPRDGLVIMFSAKIGERYLHASLEALYTESCLGPAQDIKHSSKTTHSLIKSINANVQAMHKLLPKLEGDGTGQLFSDCHGR